MFVLDVEDGQENCICQALNAAIALRKVQNFSVGSEKLFQLHRGSYIITFNSLSCLEDPGIGHIVAEVGLGISIQRRLQRQGGLLSRELHRGMG